MKFNTYEADFSYGKQSHSDTNWCHHKKEFMRLMELSENELVMQDAVKTRIALEKYERAKILEVYFARLDGRVPDEIPAELQDLYAVELPQIKSFLLGQHPQDNLLQRIFKIMN